MSPTAQPPSSFKGDWITPGHAEYKPAIARWAANAERPAAAVAFVRDAADVAAVLAHARTHKLPIAVRGGGHSPAGASSVAGGIVVDLSRYVNTVRVDAAQRRAHVGGGALWADVDAAAIKHGLATPGGTVNHTGVGGLILGGGLGHLTGRHGMVIDNLLQVTLVTADGAVLTVSETENSELFWGLRGGGGNFGVATEFVLQLHPQRATVYAGELMFPAARTEEVTAAVQRRWEAGFSADESMLQFMAPTPDGNMITMLALFYNGSEAEGREHFKDILALNPIVDMTKEIPYEQLNAVQNQFANPGMNYYMKGAHVTAIRPQTHAAVGQRIGELLVPATGQLFMYLFEYIPTKAALAVPADATAFVRTDTINAVFLAAWKEDAPGRLDAAKAAAAELSGLLLAAEDRVDRASNLGYANYLCDEMTAEELTQKDNRSALLFKDHYPRLQALKKKYDPEMVFNKWYVITPA